MREKGFAGRLDAMLMRLAIVAPGAVDVLVVVGVVTVVPVDKGALDDGVDTVGAPDVCCEKNPDEEFPVGGVRYIGCNRVDVDGVLVVGVVEVVEKRPEKSVLGVKGPLERVPYRFKGVFIG